MQIPQTLVTQVGSVNQPRCLSGTTAHGEYVKPACGCQASIETCQCNLERSPFSAWVHFAFAAAEAARRATGAAANGARREVDRERRSVRGHLLRGNILPNNSGQFRAIPGRQAVTGRRARRCGRRFLVARPLRTHGEPNGHSDTGFARKTRPPCAWDEARPSAAPGHPVRLFSTGRTRHGRGSLGQHGGAGQTAAGPAGSAAEGLDGLAGVAGATFVGDAWA